MKKLIILIFVFAVGCRGDIWIPAPDKYSFYSRDAETEECVNGGQVLEVYVNDTIANEFTVCNGLNGEDGTQTEFFSRPASDNECGDGGTVLEIYTNGILSQSIPICDGKDAPQFVYQDDSPFCNSYLLLPQGAVLTETFNDSRIPAGFDYNPGSVYYFKDGIIWVRANTEILTRRIVTESLSRISFDTREYKNDSKFQNFIQPIVITAAGEEFPLKKTEIEGTGIYNVSWDTNIKYAEYVKFVFTTTADECDSYKYKKTMMDNLIIEGREMICVE